jgi:aminoglycoside phosphotransferase (APT) family kinase protein
LAVAKCRIAAAGRGATTLTDDARLTDNPAAIDETALAAYLAASLPGFGAHLQLERCGGGQSNPTYLLTGANGRFVLRRKPPGPLLKSAHAVEREFRVMRALAGTAVPVPRVHLLCEDAKVIGTAFYVMDYHDGRIFWDPALPQLEAAERGAVYDEMNRVLAILHGLDPAALGLADFGRPGNYFARQLSRWTEQYRASAGGPSADMDRLIAWLEAELPADDGRVALVHGDYRLDNIIFAADAPRLKAVLDWELSTLGHPFADLAYQCMQLRLPAGGPFSGLGDVDRASFGIPSEADYVARYCARSGLAGIDHWTFYLAFSFFRMAAILEGVGRRASEGNAPNPERGREMAKLVPLLARMALSLIAEQGTGPTV